MIPAFAAVPLASVAVVVVAGTRRSLGRRRISGAADDILEHPAGSQVVANRQSERRAEAQGPWLDLFGKDLRRSDLSQMVLVCADMRRARLNKARLTGRDLTGALLTGADLDRAVLSRATLAGANLDWASLRHADLAGADLSGASLIEADLTGANLSGTDLSRAGSLATTTLRAARASAATRWPPGFQPSAAGVELRRE